jgi:hypothetical protein
MTMACPGPSAARSPCGAVRCRAGAQLFSVVTGVPVLRSGAKSAASRPGHENAFSEFKFQTAKPPRSRGAMRPRFAGNSSASEPHWRDGAMGGARAPMGTLEAGGETTSRGKVTARAQGKAQRLPALHRPPGRQPFRGAPGQPAFALSAEGSLLESAPSSDRTRSG